MRCASRMTESSSEIRRVVVIGASAGGVEALLEIERALPAGLPAAILATLHIPADAPSVLPRILNRAGMLHASGAKDGQRLEAGHIYTACPDQHLMLHDGVMRLS